jgi:fumarylpyruvate hydrolase
LHPSHHRFRRRIAGAALLTRRLQRWDDFHRPWTVGFRCGSGRIWLSVNGSIKQEANVAELIWPVADIITFISRSIALRPGDLIMTGTPAGVGAIVPGDIVTGGIDGLGEITITIAAAL